MLPPVTLAPSNNRNRERMAHQLRNEILEKLPEARRDHFKNLQQQVNV
ncbi:MAG: hypothetical protein R3C20_22375 [Planctomycetaceae bacterium]